MDLKLFAVLFLFAVALVSAGESDDGTKSKNKKQKERKVNANWDYEAHGPAEWDGKCRGQRQSPINIQMRDLEQGKTSNLITKHNYKAMIKGTYTVTNNGKTLQLSLPKDTKYRLRKAGQTYIPTQVLFHFDPLTGEGSEHTMNNNKFLGEIQIIHKNKKYKKKKDLMASEDGFLVIGIFVQKSKRDVTNKKNLLALQALATGISLRPGEKKKVPAFPLSYLLPKARTGRSVNYINYKGSLTYPPCTENVDWIVITGKKIEISDDLATALESVVTSNATPMAGNNRPVQPINTRLVYAVKKPF